MAQSQDAEISEVSAAGGQVATIDAAALFHRWCELKIFDGLN
jgi:hypothetical protein